jgi:hypothetical protein
MKIAILGSAPTSRLLAPLADKDWTIWACSMGNSDINRVDAWFDPHCYEGAMREGEQQWLAYLDRQPLVYMQKKDHAVKNSVPIPFDQLRQEFGEFFWEGTPSYMMAMAILQKPTHIGVYGIDMCHHTEYGRQRASCQFFIHEAWKRGIKVVIPPESEIGQPFPPYGYRDASRPYRRLEAKRKELQEKLAACEHDKNRMEWSIIEIKGALLQLQNDEIYVCSAEEFCRPSNVIPLASQPVTDSGEPRVRPTGKAKA